MTFRMGMRGHQPVVSVTERTQEQVKYSRMWRIDDYRKNSPGEGLVPVFITKAKPSWGSKVIDFGCGTGRAGMELLHAGMKVTMLDFVDHCLDAGVKESIGPDLKFICHDLEQNIPTVAEYGFCTDVLEHIPPDNIKRVLINILSSAKHCFLAIDTAKDQFGEMIGETLHLTIRPHEWWKERLTELNFRIEDEYSKDNYSVFYGSSWENVQEMVKKGELNTPEETIENNIRTNAKAGWMPVVSHVETDAEVMILGSGPTLSEYEDKIRELRSNGVKLVTLNGAYNWCLERGLIPSATVVVDARPFNKRFVTPVVGKTKYLISAQCDPDVFEGLPKDRTFIWYDGSDRTKEILGDLGISAYFHIPGGTTVLLRAIPLLRTLGYYRFHLFGCDSCLMAPAGNGKAMSFHHHAFPQPENDNQIIIPVMLNGGKVFYCNPWMAIQAKEFDALCGMMKDFIDLEVYGNGLLAQIIKTGAEIVPQEE